MAKKRTFRRRKTIVTAPEGWGYKAEWPTKLEVYPDLIRIAQSGDVILLDPPAMEYLYQLWQEVKDGR